MLGFTPHYCFLWINGRAGKHKQTLLFPCVEMREKWENGRENGNIIDWRTERRRSKQPLPSDNFPPVCRVLVRLWQLQVKTSLRCSSELLCLKENIMKFLRNNLLTTAALFLFPVQINLMKNIRLVLWSSHKIRFLYAWYETYNIQTQTLLQKIQTS